MGFFIFNLIRKCFFNILSTALLIVLSSFLPLPQTGIKVSIPNLQNNKGHVLLSLFKDGIGFPDEPEKAFRKLKIPIINKAAVSVFTDLPSGKYAIAGLHDENGDQKMNTNFFGYPKEGYGFSNNVIGLLGPPSFSKASFSYTANGTVVLSIKMRY